MSSNNVNPLTLWAKAPMLPELVDKVIEYVENIDQKKWEDGTVKDGDDYRNKVGIRKCKVSALGDEYLNKFIFSQIYAANSTTWRFHITGLVPIQYIVYDVGGHYDWHTDWMKFEDDSIRKLSMIMMLSQVGDDYDGGEFEFQTLYTKREVERIEMNRGDMLIFPSNMSHRVMPVTSGVRKVLVGWACGPMWS